MRDIFNSNRKLLILCILIGALIRIVFTVTIAEHYFGRENIYVNNDTPAWTNSFVNLIETGTYSTNPDHEYGYFLRMPGYSFFIGIFYLITGGNLEITYPLIAWIQILLDVFMIFIVYRTGMNIFQNIKTALILSLIYACYPFIIVWNPVVYSESLSIAFLIITVYFFSGSNRYRYYLSGIFISLGILNRPQLILFVPIIGLFMLFQYRRQFKYLFKYGIQFSLMIVIVYGAWPARNYFNHNKLIFTQDLRAAANWNIDVIAFMQYIYSVKPEWEPQFSNIIHNKKVSFPKEAYINKEDSLKLEKAVQLSKNCGSGFSNWQGYWNEPIEGDNCNEEIARLFTELRENQIKNNTLNFYLWVPLKNLKKALLKTRLSDTGSMIRKLASLLFYCRALLIFIGLAGCIMMIKNKNHYGIVFLLYFFSLYILLCFGTGVQFRNIEMRYFLPADVLLLIPAAYCISKIFTLLKQIKSEARSTKFEIKTK